MKKVNDIEDDIAEDLSRLHTLLDALRVHGKKQDEVADILMMFAIL